MKNKRRNKKYIKIRILGLNHKPRFWLVKPIKTNNQGP